jgi:hypothetical protein
LVSIDNVTDQVKFSRALTVIKATPEEIKKANEIIGTDSE